MSLKDTGKQLRHTSEWILKGLRMSLFSDLLFNSLLRGNLLNALLPSVCYITPLLGSHGINSDPALCNRLVCGEADVVSARLH